MMVVFLSGLSLLILEKSTKSYAEVLGIQRDNQGAIYASTVIEAMSELMKLDDASYDGLADMWVALPSIPVKDGYVYIQIRGSDAKLPINGLATADNKTQERMQTAFETLFSDLGYEDELWKSLKDWVSPAESVPVSNTVTGTTFNVEGNSYAAKYAPLDTLYEIRLLPEFPAVYEDLSLYITPGNVAPQININLAPDVVISAFLPELAPYVNEIISKREENPFTKKDDIYSIVGQGNQELYTAVLPFFDVKSSLFYVKVEVNILDGIQYYHILMSRSNKTMNVVRYIEGGPLDYF
ncbi:MAG: general secretion pathway protein GspK [Deferribacteraceae bacterium]|nr:general secretion pathway protein GspK [Deferribacteraceae bacterium]